MGVIANLALWFATHFLFRAYWAPQALPFEVPVLASLDMTALALSAVAGAAMRFGLGLGPTLLLSVGAGLVSRLS